MNNSDIYNWCNQHKHLVDDSSNHLTPQLVLDGKGWLNSFIDRVVNAPIVDTKFEVNNPGGIHTMTLNSLLHSDDYKERFQGEYAELVIRIEKLHTMISKYHNHILDFVPDTPIALLEDQLAVMKRYRSILSERAQIENIDLEMLRPLIQESLS